MPRPDYHTQHAPLGAFASFTLGLNRSGGGFGHALSGPAGQSVFVGYRKRPDGAWRLLPFFTPADGNAESLFTGENAQRPRDGKSRPAAPAEFRRELGWASDCWQLGKLKFSLFTPWDQTIDPAAMTAQAARRAFAPVVCGQLEFDNSESDQPAELLFGLGDPAQPARPLSDAAPDLAGFAVGSAYGYATPATREVACRQAFDITRPKFFDHRGLHLLGNEHGLVFTVPARRQRTFPIALGFYQEAPVTTGMRCHYYYTRLFDNLEDVLQHGLAEHGRYLSMARQRDQELVRARLSADQRWLLAQATHSYLGSTQLLWHRGQPLWVVNEGEYRMMNTFDLTVDHLFFELAWHPWAVRRTLELFKRRYSYRDRIHHPAGRRAAGGLSFTHDMGMANQFTPAGTSAYECRDLHGCFSHMTMEQLVNWVCCACTYAERTRDRAWLRAQFGTLRAAGDSLRQRDDPQPARRNGILKWDSDRCGPTGSEITTYDSLDVSLGQARNNLYLAVKCLAAWLLLERAFQRLGSREESRAAGRSADLTAQSVAAAFDDKAGFIPAVFEGHNRSRILPAIEGLVFPLTLGFASTLRSRYPALFHCLERHLRGALRPGACVDARSGAWKISSTSHNTWFSKIALAQHVIRCLFPGTIGRAAARGDAVHARFQQRPALGRFALVDQFHASTGQDLGSRYYPRGVTAFLWLYETR